MRPGAWILDLIQLEDSAICCSTPMMTMLFGPHRIVFAESWCAPHWQSLCFARLRRTRVFRVKFKCKLPDI
eukprot:3331412-Rhodomonas_salina.10